MIYRKFIYASLAALAALASAAPCAAGGDQIQQHMRHLLNDGDQWRTPNPQYDQQRNGPAEFGLRFELAPDGAHVTGELTGIRADGREVLYWSLLALYNPVTERVVTQQVGWDGTLVYGEVPLQTGKRQIVDAISFAPDGTLQMTRHDSTFARRRHTSVVYDKTAEGWARAREWQWRRTDLPEQRTVVPAASSEHVPALQAHAGFLLVGSGRWRAANPDFQPGSGNEKFYGINYRWGLNRQHVVGEIVSIHEDGRVEKDWSLYITYNPVSGKAVMQQTGASGVYFHGEVGVLDNGLRENAGLVYMPNGRIKSVRDEIEIVDSDTYIAHVFERDDEGGWNKVRQWTWRLQDND